MDTLEIAAKMVRDAVTAMSTKFSEFVKAGLDDKQDIATMPTKVSDFTNDSGFQDAQQVEDKIDAKISSAYKAGGSATMAALPALTAAKLGVVVNMSEDFTTTSDFLEGAGKTYPAGTNVVVALAGENTYKYDVLAGFVDLSGYVQNTRKVGNVPLSADIPVSLAGDTAITVTNTGTASAIGYSVSHNNSGVTAGSKGDTSAQTPGFGGTFKALSVTVDAKGHVTVLGDHNVTIPSATATSQNNGLMSSSDKAKLDALSVTASNPLEVTKTGETYNVTLKDSGVTAGSKGNASNQTPGFGGTFKTLSATVDAKGRLTALNERNVTIPSDAATTSAAGLMSAADKNKLDNIIDATLSNIGQAADAKATGDALAALRNYLKSMEVYRTASGNPATFDDGKAANLKDVTVTITPTQSGSGDPSPTNIRPISGVSSVTVTRTGKNLLVNNLSGTFNVNNLQVKINPDKSITVATYENSGSVLIQNMAVGPNGGSSGEAGSAKTHLSPGSYRIPFSGAEHLYVQMMKDGQLYANEYGDYVFTAPEGGVDVYFRFRIWLGSDMKGRTYTVFPALYRDDGPVPAYEPYQGQTVTVSPIDSNANPLTVYGGTLNVTTGELSVTWENIASYNGETLPGRWISDRDVYAAGTTPTTGAQIVYELAPDDYQTYTLTPAQLAALAGYNSVFADAGTLNVTYKADTSITFGGA